MKPKDLLADLEKVEFTMDMLEPTPKIEEQVANVLGQLSDYYISTFDQAQMRGLQNQQLQQAQALQQQNQLTQQQQYTGLLGWQNYGNSIRVNDL